MKFYELAFRYLTKKKGKTLILFLVLLTMNSMILSTSMILRATEDSKHSIQEKTGSKVVAEVNTDKSGIDEMTISQIEKMKDVSTVNRAGRNSAFPSNFKPITNNSSKDKDNQTVSLLSYNNLEKDSPFTDRIYKLVEGSYIPDKKRGVVIHSDLAQMNGLKIGDTIEFSNDNGNNISAKIIGLFSSVGNTEKLQTDSTTSINRIENQIFMDTETYSNLINENQYYKIVVYTKNPQQISGLVKELQTILGSDISITTADTLYKRISAPLEQISKVANIMLILTLVTGVVVLSLLLCMWSRTRQKEIAIFMSLGKKKTEIVLQMLLESFGVFFLSVIGASTLGILFLGFLQNIMSAVQTSNFTITIALKLQDIGLLFGLGSMIILVAMCWSIIPTLRANPKNILAKMEG